MAPTYRGGVQVHNESSSINVPAPTGVQSGDFQLIVVHIATDGETVTWISSGWTYLGELQTHGNNNTAVEMYTSTTALGSCTVRKDGSRPWVISRVAYSNHGGYRAGSLQQAWRTGTSVAIPTATTIKYDSLVISGAILDPGESIEHAPTGTTPVGWTERLRGSSGSSEYQTNVVADQVVSSPGTADAVYTWESTPGGEGQTFSLVLDGSTPTIAPAGMPSGLAFGTLQVVPGQVTISPTGIASGSAFGTLSVGPGQQINNVGGIASAEVFGDATVTPGTATVHPAGIASGFAFGALHVVPGQVTIAISAGIATGEAFGEARFSYGFAVADLPRAYPRTEIPYPAITYELVCVARIPQSTGEPTFLQVDPIDWLNLSFTDELSKPQALSATAKVDGMTEPVKQRLRKLDELGTEVWLYRQGRLVFAGPIFGWQRQGDVVTITANGLLAYLRYWVVEADLVYAQVDQNLIVKGLIDHWQGSDFGNYGLDTSSMTASGVLRDATYLQKELHPIAKRVEEMGQRENGFDIEVDPLTRKVRLWNPMQGVDRSFGEDAIVFDERNVTSDAALCSAAPGDLASDAFGTGTSLDSTIWSTASNANLRASFGRCAVAASFDGVTEQTTLDAHTQGLVDARSQSLIIPGPDVRTTVDADLDSYGVGDTVSYRVDQALGVSGAFRIRKRIVTVTSVGREKTSIEFV